MFEQRKELLLLEMERGKLVLEMKRFKMEEHMQSLSGPETGVVNAPFSAGFSGSFDLASNLQLVSQFCEWDPNTFFLTLQACGRE